MEVKKIRGVKFDASKEPRSHVKVLPKARSHALPSALKAR